MASGHVSRIKRPNTWLHRPMLQNVKKLLPIRSRPHMAQSEAALSGRLATSAPTTSAAASRWENVLERTKIR
jgi:hypothetical protein